MSKATTAQVEESENKGIIEKFSHQEYALITEELDILRKATLGLWKIAETTDDEKFRASIYQWFVSSLIPKPIQQTDVTSGGEKVPWVINTNLDI
jgi:hypothetical protein